MKKTLLLLHGALGSNRYFRDLKTRLALDFNCYALNFEGHGGETTENEFSIDLFATNLIDFLDQNKLTNVLVFGYSMGGYVALTVANKRPELIEKIVTLGTKFNWSPELAAKEIRMLNPEIVEEKILKFAENLKSLHYPADWKIVMQKTAHLMQLLADGKGLKEEDFKNIQHKVIIGIGSADKMVTLEESERVAHLLPNGSLKVIENAPHPIEMVDLEVLSTYILASLVH